MADSVSVVVVTMAVKDYLDLCMDSLRRQSYPGIEVIVIDNSSCPGLNDRIAGRYPQVRVYAQPENAFYSQALNRGVGLSRGDFILCLNDDVILDNGFIKEALKGFSAAGRIGMVSGKILRRDDRTIDSTGLFLSIFRSAKERGYGCKDRGQYGQAGYIFGVNGAAAFYRRAMLEDIKRGTEYFPAYYRIFYEDLDIAWRAQNSGWRGYYIPSALAYHIRGGTVRQEGGINKRYARAYLNDELHTCLVKNRYRTILRNESFFGFLLYLPFIVAYDLFAWGYILLFRSKLLKKFFLDFKSCGEVSRDRGGMENVKEGE
jgi:GT2 family glycosyltransferase